MTDSYIYFYILNTNTPKNEEILIDFAEITEFDKILKELPEYEPSESVIKDLFKLI